MSLTEEAYAYAVRKKKVNQGVIEAYKDGATAGGNKVLRLPAIEFLELAVKKFRDSETIQMHLGYSDARRGFNEEEIKEAKMRKALNEILDKYKKDE